MNVLRMYSILVVIYALEFDNVVGSRYMFEKRLNYLHYQFKHLFLSNQLHCDVNTVLTT